MPDSGPPLPLPFLLTRLAHLFRTAVGRSLARRGYAITPEEAMAMLVIAETEQDTVQGVAETLFRDRTTVSRLLSSLEKKGLIERFEHPGDRRSVAMRVTELGDRFRQEMSAEGGRDMAVILGGIAPENIATTLATMEAMQANLQVMLEQSEENY